MSDATLIHVVDDDEAVRDSLGFLLRSEGYRVQAHASALEALEVLRQGGGDAAECLVTDVRMPGMTGLELLAQVRALGRRLPVVVITGHGDVPLAVEAMREGADDFIEKPFDDEVLLSAVARAVNARQLHASPAMSEPQKRLASLSQRERQVLQGLVAGRLNKTIAHDLGISVRTVEVYRAKLMAKMKVDSFADLVKTAMQAGLSDAQEP